MKENEKRFILVEHSEFEDDEKEIHHKLYSFEEVKELTSICVWWDDDANEYNSEEEIKKALLEEYNNDKRAQKKFTFERFFQEFAHAQPKYFLEVYEIVGTKIIPRRDLTNF